MGHVSSYPRADVESSVGSLVDGGANGYAPPVDHHAAPSAALRCPQPVGFRWGHHPFPLRRAPPPRHSSRIPTFVPRIPTFVTNPDTPAANLQVRPCAPRAPRAASATTFVTNVERKCTASPLGAARGIARFVTNVEIRATKVRIRHECRVASAPPSPLGRSARDAGFVTNVEIRHECRAAAVPRSRSGAGARGATQSAAIVQDAVADWPGASTIRSVPEL